MKQLSSKITWDFPDKRFIPACPDNCIRVVLVTSICDWFIFSHIGVLVASGFPAFIGVLLRFDGVLFTAEGGVLFTVLKFRIPDMDPLLVVDTAVCCSLWIGWFGSARSNSGWITSDWKTEFFCQRFSTRITLLWNSSRNWWHLLVFSSKSFNLEDGIHSTREITGRVKVQKLSTGYIYYLICDSHIKKSLSVKLHKLNISIPSHLALLPLPIQHPSSRFSLPTSVSQNTI